MEIRNWFGRKFKIESQENNRHWEEVRFIDLNSGQTFYRLTRDLTKLKSILNDRCPRAEYFNSEPEPKQQFNGRKNCFFHFCNALVPFVEVTKKTGDKCFPTESDFKETARELNLPADAGRLYAYYYRKFFQL